MISSNKLQLMSESVINSKSTGCIIKKIRNYEKT